MKFDERGDETKRKNKKSFIFGEQRNHEGPLGNQLALSVIYSSSDGVLGGGGVHTVSALYTRKGISAFDRATLQMADV